ncbi:hypothetical protein LTR09_003080 [Extremus antarcticus]|uniref:Uncharacterized protein n=1 Tax=Extremus antarcticus TaxID=702011 RepID=A0AAJ0LUP1_9PEZI|nr:hypothetical protein LTR09_003080 [Extremus antarcticus]
MSAATKSSMGPPPLPPPVFHRPAKAAEKTGSSENNLLEITLAKVTFTIPFRLESEKQNIPGARKANVAIYDVGQTRRLKSLVRLDLANDNDLRHFLQDCCPDVRKTEVDFLLFPGFPNNQDKICGMQQLDKCVASGEVKDDVERALLVLWPLQRRFDRLTCTVNGQKTGAFFGTVRTMLERGQPPKGHLQCGEDNERPSLDTPLESPPGTTLAAEPQPQATLTSSSPDAPQQDPARSSERP